MNSSKRLRTGQEWSPFAWVPLLRKRQVSVPVSGVQCEFDSQSISCFIRRLELIFIIFFMFYWTALNNGLCFEVFKSSLAALVWGSDIGGPFGEAEKTRGRVCVADSKLKRDG